MTPIRTMIKYSAYGGLAALAFYYAYQGQHGYVDLTYIAACVLVVLTNVRLANIVTLVSALAVVKAAEYLVFENFFDYFNAYALYATYVLTDLLLMLYIYFRVPIIRGVLESNGIEMDEEKWFITNADLLLALIQLLHVVVGALMLLEHLLRNLHDVYLPQLLKRVLPSESIDTMVNWLSHNAMLVYNNFIFLELSITGLEFIVILGSTSHYLKNKN